MFELVETVVFRAFGSIDIADKGSMPSSLTVLVLGDFGIYVGAPNSSEMTSNIE